MHIDRRAFLATLGSAAVVEAMSPEAKADALEHYLLAQLDKPAAPAAKDPGVRKGAGALFGGPSPSGVRVDLVALAEMPAQPTLVDFIRLRGTPGINNHILKSAGDALKKGEPEETVLACLLHDYVLNLVKTDHGWWGAQMFEPYVSEKVSWAIRHHQALRFYPDPSVGYEYPELYVRIFGKDYVPAPYIKASYERGAQAQVVHGRAHDHGARPIRLPAGDEGVDRSFRRHHREAFQAAEGGPGLRRQPRRPYVAHAKLSG